MSKIIQIELNGKTAPKLMFIRELTAKSIGRAVQNSITLQKGKITAFNDRVILVDYKDTGISTETEQSLVYL